MRRRRSGERGAGIRHDDQFRLRLGSVDRSMRTALYGVASAIVRRIKKEEKEEETQP
jgi:hypothetical protein